MPAGFGHFESKDYTREGMAKQIEQVRSDSMIAVESVLVAVKSLREEVAELQRKLEAYATRDAK